MIRKKIKIIIFTLLMTTIAAMVVISNYQPPILGEVNYRQSKPSSILQKKQFVAHARYFSAEHPNNSLSLYKKLVEDDLYQIIETDVLFTKDNIPVLSHETNIRDIAVDENGLPANIEIKNISYAELRKFNFETKSLQGGGKYQPYKSY